jgi:hypothetical protein
LQGRIVHVPNGFADMAHAQTATACCWRWRSTKRSR